MGITILLVEDNALNRDMLSRRLIKRGYDIKIAVNGEEGIRMAEEYLPEIILMDLSLPIIDGWEATRTIKSRAITKSIPIIALTAHAMSGDEAKAKAAGCNDYDTKPIDLNRLLDKINNLLFPNIL
jgi:two-component system cell cycle response regulator DivK